MDGVSAPMNGRMAAAKAPVLRKSRRVAKREFMRRVYLYYQVHRNWENCRWFQASALIQVRWRKYFFKRQSRDNLLWDDAEKTLALRIGMLPVDVHAEVGDDSQRHPSIQVAGGLQGHGLSQRNGQLPGETL